MKTPHKHLHHPLLLPVLLCCNIVAALTACSNIDENERLELVSTQVVPYDTPEEKTEEDSLYDAPIKVVESRVLIEDHTGQKCPNCPDGAQTIRDLQRTYGSRIVPVAIHSQMQGIMEPEGLGNELVNTYYNYWHIEYKHAALINRIDVGTGRVFDKTIWPYAAQYILTDETPNPLDIRIKAHQTAEASADIDVKVIATTAAAVSGKLQVWLTEDNIVARQDSMGSRLDNYVHSHVLRAAANGTWGEDVSVSGAEGSNVRELHYSVSLAANWKPADLAIVAFVYTDEKVVQVSRSKLKVKE